MACYTLYMKTNTFRLIVQQRVCRKLIQLQGDAPSGCTLDDLNYVTTRVCNELLIELGFNQCLWARVYKNRVFIYDIASKRAVIELGIIATPHELTAGVGARQYTGFDLMLLGGIYNRRVTPHIENLMYTNK